MVETIVWNNNESEKDTKNLLGIRFVVMLRHRRSAGKGFVKHDRTNPGTSLGLRSLVVIVDDVEHETEHRSDLQKNVQLQERTCLDMISFAIDTGGGV